MFVAMSLAELYFEVIPALVVQLDSSLGAPQELQWTLWRSCIVSSVLLAKAFADLDAEGYCFRYINAIPVLTGTAAVTSFRYVLVLLFRLCGVVSRLLILAFMAEAAQGSLPRSGLAMLVGFFALMLAFQAALIWRTTG